jgi:predicted nicotinamide N-methyase
MKRLLWLYLLPYYTVACKKNTCSTSSSPASSRPSDEKKAQSIVCDDTVCLKEKPPVSPYEQEGSSHHDDDDDALVEAGSYFSSSAFNPIGMKSYVLEFPDTNLSLTLLQSHSAFDESGKDDTGLVLWGASVALGRFLAKDGVNKIIPNGSTVMELGCGTAVPSLVVACSLEPSRVIATDFRSATLSHVHYHGTINQDCTSRNGRDSERGRRPVPIETYRVNWEDGTSQERLIERHTGYPDVILAADVIYGVALVPALVETISRFLPRHGRLILATRDGRLGIPEFLDLLESDFQQIHIESYGEDEPPRMPPIPAALKDDVHSVGRYYGNFSIYVYERSQESASLELIRPFS